MIVDDCNHCGSPSLCVDSGVAYWAMAGESPVVTGYQRLRRDGHSRDRLGGRQVVAGCSAHERDGQRVSITDGGDLVGR